MTDFAALLIIAGMATFGWLRGTVAMALWAGGLLAGYGGALLLFRPVGSLLAQVSGLPAMATYPFAGFLVFVLVSSGVGWYARGRRRQRARRMDKGWEPPAWDAPGGLLLGATYGGVLALILAWAAGSIGGLYGSGNGEAIRSSLTGRAGTAVAEQALSLGTQAMVGDPFVARTMAHVVADPVKATEALQEVMSDARVVELARSDVLRRAAASQDPDELARSAPVRALAADDQFVSVLREFGVLRDGSGTVTPEEISAALVREAGPVLRSVDALKNDEEVLSMLGSASFREALEQGDYGDLARDQRFTRLIERILEEVRRQR
jgi:hypothetical protein